MYIEEFIDSNNNGIIDHDFGGGEPPSGIYANTTMRYLRYFVGTGRYNSLDDVDRSPNILREKDIFISGVAGIDAYASFGLPLGSIVSKILLRLEKVSASTAGIISALLPSFEFSYESTTVVEAYLTSHSDADKDNYYFVYITASDIEYYDNANDVSYKIPLAAIYYRNP